MNYKTTRIIKTSDVGPFEEHIWKYELELPEWLAKWDVYDYWEKERIFSMESNLKKGDILFDVGAESGWLSALYAKYIVGGENMVLFEPGEKYWSTIKAIFEQNQLGKPKAFYDGFVSNEDKRNHWKQYAEYPQSVNESMIEGGMPYGNLKNEDDKKKHSIVSLDTCSKKMNIIPRAITIDVEGAEMLVLKGSIELLRNVKPLLWISVHPDLALKNFNIDSNALHAWLKKMGYIGEHISTDHEEHWFYQAK